MNNRAFEKKITIFSLTCKEKLTKPEKNEPPKYNTTGFV